MPGPYIPPHKRLAQTTMSHKHSPKYVKKFAFFGDSFVRLFGLVEHPSINVRAFKGASAKGLGRSENENSHHIAQYLDQQPHLERCIFSFGNVDVHMSFYYKTYVLNEVIALDEIAKTYVEFVASLPTKAKRTIVGVYPSPLEDTDVAESLLKYGSIQEDQKETVAASDDVKLRVRQERVKSFNYVLAQECQKHGIQYVDLMNEIMDNSTLKIREAYRDVSDQNVHVVWETTILLWLEKFPWLKRLAPPTFQARLNRTLKEYLATKPWAERTHVSQKQRPRNVDF